MYLSRIEIFGFKSFAQKLVVELGPGMTAVVGPNGCGKTNISDAVRWALGEHNIRMLRGKLLEDVIFAGSPRRDPLGMAEVTLTFSNAEGAFNLGLAEVSITRRVFRSGESEFLLNGVPCRLKEITDQLMDRGLGHRGYAIIEREMVERVLEDTSRERRALLEEAAGIARYKAREKAARRKLELTEQDLRRLQDIVGEVEKRVESLRRQVGKAKRYQEYEARLREAETLLVRTEYRELKDRGARIAEERREARLRVEALRAELRTAENEREVVRAARDEADRALSRAEADVAAVTREATELEGKVEVLRERRRSFLEGAQRSEQEAENHAGRRGECLRRHQEGQAEEGRLRIEAQNLVGKQESEAKALADLDRDYGERQAALEERRSANMTALEERVSRSQELQSSHRTLEQLTEKEKEHRRREEELLGEKEHLESEVGERASTLKQLAEALLSAEEDRNRARRHLAELETARAEREERERELGVELRGIESHVAVLKELDERFEGFSRSVRELMQEARAGGAGTRGVRGLVGELLSSGDERVTAALEVALEEGLDCVVTEDLASARELLSFMREGRRGRATFLPLASLNGHNGNGSGATPGKGNGRPVVLDRLRGTPGVVGPALDFVSCEEGVRPVAEFLLRQTVITEDLDAAERLAAQPEWAPLRFVTLAGESFCSPGVVTGGSVPEGDGSPFNRARRIAEMEKKLVEVGRKRREAGELRQEVTRELEGLRARIEEMETEIAGTRRREQEEREELSRLRGVLLGTEHRRQHLDEERERLRAEREATETAVARLTEESSQLEEAGRSAHGELARVEAELRTLGETRDAARNRLHDIALQLTARRGRLDALADEIPRLVKEAEAAAKGEERARAAVAEARAQAEALGKSIATEEEALRRFADEIRARGERRDEAAARVAELVSKEKGIERRIAETRETMGSVSEEGHQLEIAAREVEVATENLVKQAPAEVVLEGGEEVPAPRRPAGPRPFVVAAELRAAWAAAGGSPVPDQDASGGDGAELTADELRARVEELRGKIQRLGPVNFVALEEYETERDRFEFLTEQRNDLIQSRDALLEAARKINRTARKRFLETFEEVRRHFRETFTILFDDGAADLSLPEGMDPLECPIEIMARPRGKTLREVSLLSGGERCLSAISLLVALYKVKPSPFCIMDEVDAPLDDSNVLRFTGMLNRLKEKTQFLVITHNKRSMEAADVLYGVTMDEPGVSSMISVKLEEARQWALDEPVPAEGESGNGADGGGGNGAGTAVGEPEAAEVAVLED